MTFALTITSGEVKTTVSPCRRRASKLSGTRSPGLLPPRPDLIIAPSEQFGQAGEIADEHGDATDRGLTGRHVAEIAEMGPKVRGSRNVIPKRRL